MHRVCGMTFRKQVHAFLRQVAGALLVERCHAVFRIKSERGAVLGRYELGQRRSWRS
jgi:hypothetical protein